MGAELLVIILVALIVFGPNKLPMLAEHLAKLFSQINYFKKEAVLLWHKVLAQSQLLENQKKAEEADVKYKGHSAESDLR